ncbi:MAG: hypothetical protein QOI12_1420 [Alphaproteobacteria bacterium]|jgi:uncharacterized membrane protein YhaH (DUF805 family)|nr:hypothetical protein [Alphaproteobacteria bacterium]
MGRGSLLTSFEGRISRKRYWIGIIVLMIAMIVLTVVIAYPAGLSLLEESRGQRLLSFALQLVFLYPSAALMVKRLHDRNRPGAFALLLLVPFVTVGLTDLYGITGNALSPNAYDVILTGILLIVSIWFLVELGFLRGTIGPNRYGPDPLAPSTAAPTA